MTDVIEPQRLPGMTPRVCSYYGPDGRRYGIVLHGSSREQVLEDNCDALFGLTIDGEDMGTIPVGPDGDLK